MINQLTRKELKIYLQVLQDKTTWNNELKKAVRNGLNVETEIIKVKGLLNI